MKTGAIVGALALVLAGAARQSVVPPNVPDDLKAPEGEKALMHAHAKGVQIYSCAAGTDGKYSWVLKAPKTSPPQVMAWAGTAGTTTTAAASMGSSHFFVLIREDLLLRVPGAPS